MIGESNSAATAEVAPATLQQQALAGQLLLTRRHLMDRVKNSLRPLFRGHILQVLIGVALVALGAQCWAPNTSVPHKLFNGVIVHVYGVLVIACAVAVIVRIKKIDYSKPVDEVRKKLDTLCTVYLCVGPVIGFPWC